MSILAHPLLFTDTYPASRLSAYSRIPSCSHTRTLHRASLRTRTSPRVPRQTLARPGPRQTSTLPLMLTSARPPTRAREVARTVVAPLLSVVKCLWEVFVWGCGVLFLSCVCVSVSVSGVLFSVCACACDLLIFLQAYICAYFSPVSAQARWAGG